MPRDLGKDIGDNRQAFFFEFQALSNDKVRQMEGRRLHKVTSDRLKRDRADVRQMIGSRVQLKVNLVARPVASVLSLS